MILLALYLILNTMIVSGGNIQNVNRSNDINTYSSDYAIYQPIKAFPVEPDDPLSFHKMSLLVIHSVAPIILIIIIL